MAVATGSESEAEDFWDTVAPSYGSSPVSGRLAEALVDLVGISRGDAVLDLGTGTGLALIPAARASATGPAVGLDRSPAMLGIATARLVEAGLARVGLVRADAASVPAATASFDVVLAASVWQFLGYAPEALAEWRRVLRPGGRLGLSVPGRGSGLSVSVELQAKYFDRLSPAYQERLLAGGGGVPMPDIGKVARQTGLSAVEVVTRSQDHRLPSPESWWDIQWTHGMRRFLEGLDSESLGLLKADALAQLALSEKGEVLVTTNTIYCLCSR